MLEFAGSKTYLYPHLKKNAFVPQTARGGGLKLSGKFRLECNFFYVFPKLYYIYNTSKGKFIS